MNVDKGGKTGKAPFDPVEKGFRFRCTGCGLCCRWGGKVYLYADDVLRLAGHFGMELQPFVDKYCDHVLIRFGDEKEEGQGALPFLVLKNTTDADPTGCGQACLFLGEDNLCSVHMDKPAQCADSPVIPEYMEDDEMFAQFVGECPGMGEGVYHKPEDIRETLIELARRDAAYEEELAQAGYDLGELLGVQLPAPQEEEGVAVEVGEE